MKYVITGGAGHISAPLAEKLLAAGQEVTVIGRNAENLKTLTDKGAKAAIGSVEDGVFLNEAFKGADAVYLMIPPNFSLKGEWRSFQNEVGDRFIEAIRTNNIKYVVVLSSIGAHRGNGVGPVDGLADLEKKFISLPDVNVKFLRPSYFMYNFISMIPLLKNAGIMGSNFFGTDEKLVLTHTEDIADAAAEELLALNFTGQSVRYIANDERSTDEIAKVLGAAVGKPDTSWVVFTDEQSLSGMKTAGLADTIANGYTEMGKSLREGKMQEDYWKHRPQLGKRKLEDFAKEFAEAYNG